MKRVLAGEDVAREEERLRSLRRTAAEVVARLDELERELSAAGGVT